MSKKTIKLKESDIRRIVENIMNDTNEISGVEDEFDLDSTKGGGMEDAEDNEDEMSGSGCSSKFTIGKDENGTYYVIDLLKNQVIASK